MGSSCRSADDELVFVTTDAQLLHFPASGVRPQGRSGGGIAGVRLAAGARVGLVRRASTRTPTTSWSTVAGSSDALPGTEAGTVKVTPFAEYPGKGRGTGGVRCHRFLKGEDTLLVAYAGRRPRSRRPRPAGRRSTSRRSTVAATAPAPRPRSRSSPSAAQPRE